MASYGDSALIKKRVGVSFSDLGLANDAALDDLIEDLNERSSAEVQDFCQRDFDHHVDDVVVMDGNNRDTIALPNYPAISISEVQVGDDVLAADTYRVRASPSMPAENSGILQRKRAVWPRDWENLQITYTWGYAAPPPAVKEVVEDLVIRTILEAYRNKKTKGASSIGLDGFSITFGVGFTTENPTSLDSVAKQKLSPYKRVVLA